METIAIDATSALAQGGGIGRFTRGLLQGLAGYDTSRRYLLVHASEARPHSTFQLPPNFRWRSLKLTQKQSVWLWHRLRVPLPADLLVGSPELFHSPDYTLPPLYRARGIVTVHDLSFEALEDVHEPSLRRYLQRAVPYSIERADHVFADSENTRQEIMRYYGTAASKITVIYPGVEERFRPMDSRNEEDSRALAEVRAAYRIGRPFILGLGTLEPRKNFGTLIRAFAEYRQKEQAVDLLLAGGSGWLGQRETLQELTHQLGIADVVRFLGFVEDVHLPALINLAQAVIYPSRYEGFGLPVLEALACGVPVVTARNSSLPEAGGDAARYIDDANDYHALAQEIFHVLNDTPERTRMIAEGLKHAARFTWAATARQVVNLYEKVLAGPNGANIPGERA